MIKSVQKRQGVYSQKIINKQKCFPKTVCNIVSQTKAGWGLVLHWGQWYSRKQKQCECEWELPQFNASSLTPVRKQHQAKADKASWKLDHLCCPPDHSISLVQLHSDSCGISSSTSVLDAPRSSALTLLLSLLIPFLFLRVVSWAHHHCLSTPNLKNCNSEEQEKEQLVVAAGLAPSGWPGTFSPKRARQKWQTFCFQFHPRSLLWCEWCWKNSTKSFTTLSLHPRNRVQNKLGYTPNYKRQWLKF